MFKSFITLTLLVSSAYAVQASIIQYTTHIIAPNNFSQLLSGHDFCELEKKHAKIDKACIPLANISKNTQLEVNVKDQAPQYLPAGEMYALFADKGVQSVILTVINTDNNTLIYSGQSNDMEGLVCDETKCLPWD